MTEEKMDNQNHKYIVRKAKPGFLIKSRGRYYIAPCNREERILIKNYQDAYNDIIRFRDSRVTWHGSKAYIITGQPSSNLKNSKEYEKIKNNIVELKKAGKQHIRFVDLQSMCWERNQWIEVPDEVLNEYRHDKTRKGLYLLANRRNSSNRIDGCLNRNDLQRLDIYSEHSYIIDKIIDTLIPCHYLIEDKRLTAFGHGQCFRIPYQNSISDGIPKALNSDIIDFTDAVFGRERYWASKIFIEDAKPETTIETFDVLPSKPLMNPNPTSYQLYLTQKQNGELIHYDTLEMRLRGYKNYWHNKAIPDWIVRDEDAINLDKSKPEDKRLIRYIAPVKKGCKFKSKIRFKNLSPLELGALLTVFDLSGNGKTCAYKLGAGKPWGFGSFKIKAQLFLDDEKKDYTKLFNDDNTFYNPAQQITNIDTYLETFAEYIKNQGMENSWMHIMGELCDILEWDGIGKGQRKNWQNKIKSMSGNVMRNTNTGRNSVDERFIQRAPLPTIAEVLKQ